MGEIPFLNLFILTARSAVAVNSQPVFDFWMSRFLYWFNSASVEVDASTQEPPKGNWTFIHRIYVQNLAFLHVMSCSLKWLQRGMQTSHSRIYNLLVRHEMRQNILDLEPGILLNLKFRRSWTRSPPARGITAQFVQCFVWSDDQNF